jgi:flagellar biosynthesis protein FlhB
MSDKTEQPTPRRLRKAREAGDSPLSGSLVQNAGFIAALAVAPAAVAALVARSGSLIHSALTQPLPRSVAGLLAREVIWLSAPMLLAAALGAALMGLVQTGGIVSARRIAPDLERLNPVTCLGNLIAWSRFFGLLRALAAALLIAYLAFAMLRDHAADLVGTLGSVGQGAALGAVLLERLVWGAALVGLGLAGLDWLVTFQAWQRRLRMSRDEIRREHREAEGDPELKAARRRAHEEALRGATILAVKDATVLVVNPTHLATALSYHDQEDDAPRVVAQGRGELAQRMIEAAHAYGVPVVRDVPVAQALGDLEVGDQIPEALYEAVAEILRDAWEQGEAREL